MFVLDNGKITEVDMTDNFEVQEFNDKYNFSESGLYDIPQVRGVRTFVTGGNRLVLVGHSPANIAAEACELIG